MKVKITKKAAEAFTAGERSEATLWDAAVQGFGLRAKNNLLISTES